MDPDAFIAVCVERPAIHRFPANMARRVQELCRVLASDYDGEGSKVWTEAADGADLYARIGALPGFGDMKINSLAMLLHRRYGVDLPGLEALLPTHPVLGGVTTAEELAAYQAHKRAKKAARERPPRQPFRRRDPGRQRCRIPERQSVTRQADALDEPVLRRVQIQQPGAGPARVAEAVPGARRR